MVKVVVVGLGEMGASLALALNQSPKNQVIGVDRDPGAISYALKHGIIGQGVGNLDAVADQADLIILAVPVRTIESMLAHLAELPLKRSVIVTDAGSTKREILEAAEKYLSPRQIHFVGGHAMAGTHLAGVQAAKLDLYRDAAYFMIPSRVTPPAVVQLLIDRLAPLQANFILTSIGDHDQLMAVISDVPHIAAFALMNSAVQLLGPSQNFGQYVAGGFKDMTRIAASDPKLWTDVLLSNPDAILATQKHYRNELDRFYQAIERGDQAGLESMIRRAQEDRMNLLKGETDD
ncbi:prephenate dehydrogenase/arogenate dehydrogenase family protein [Leuconostocaceae bacterium ESL0723]|nr:prephenate dehydrogenase/arogenate dehydrogenase family protein [Leuconostocaceae bacterium ESL0723]